MISKSIISAALLTSSILFSYEAAAHGDIKHQLEETISYGQVEKLVHIFDDNITLELFDNTQKLSSKEAEMVIKEFFEKYPPATLRLDTQGTYANDTRHFTGVYKTKDGITYNAYFEATLDLDNGHYHVSLIRIEK